MDFIFPIIGALLLFYIFFILRSIGRSGRINKKDETTRRMYNVEISKDEDIKTKKEKEKDFFT